MSKLFINTSLNIKSDKITILLSKEDGKVFRVLYREDLKYDGYTDGKFFDEDSVLDAVKTLVKNAEQYVGVKIKTITVGVPGEFTPVVNKKVRYNFENACKITPKIIEKIHKYGDTYTSKGKFVALVCTPNFYGTDSLEKASDIVGMVTKNVVADLSYILADKYFVDLFDMIAKNINVKVEYCPTILSEALYVLPRELSGRGAILVDSDFMSTSVTYVKDDSVLFSATFPVGTAYIVSELMDRLNITYAESLELLNKINLNIDFSEDSVYALNFNGSTKNYLMSDVHAACLDVLYLVSDCIKKAVEKINKNIDENVSIALTGDGIGNIIGVKSIIEQILNRFVVIVSPMHTELNSASDALIESLMVYTEEFQKNMSILEKIRSLFNI